MAIAPWRWPRVAVGEPAFVLCVATGDQKSFRTAAGATHSCLQRSSSDRF